MNAYVFFFKFVLILIVQELKSSKGHKLSEKEYKGLYNTFFTSLCLFSNRYLNDIERSKDVVQAVFIKIWVQDILFENELTVKTYLYTSVKNTCLDFLKSKENRIKQKLSTVELRLLKSEAYFEKEVVLEEVARIVDRSLETLPFKCKQIIKLSLKGFKNKQISEELEISINTVKTQKRIAYQRLRPILKGYYL